MSEGFRTFALLPRTVRRDKGGGGPLCVDTPHSPRSDSCITVHPLGLRVQCIFDLNKVQVWVVTATRARDVSRRVCRRSHQ